MSGYTYVCDRCRYSFPNPLDKGGYCDFYLSITSTSFTLPGTGQTYEGVGSRRVWLCHTCTIALEAFLRNEPSPVAYSAVEKEPPG